MSLQLGKENNDAETVLRKELAKLDVQRKSMEHEADAIFLELTTPPAEGVEPMGIDTPLVDRDGYPRGDIDIYRTRTLRRRFRELKTDHKEISHKIEGMLVQLAVMKNANKETEIQKEILARKAPKPKPKYDPVTGKWVVMNWDGTVSGIPGGELRNFAELDRQVSGLTGDDDFSSLGSSVVNSTRSATTAEHEPRPPAQVGRETSHGLERPFARIDAVAKDSPAQQAGLREEDLIVTFGHLNADNHDHLRAITELVPEVAVQKQSIEICLLRRIPPSETSAIGEAKAEDEWKTLTLKLTPQPWSGRGMIGCHIVPYSR